MIKGKDVVNKAVDEQKEIKRKTQKIIDEQMKSEKVMKFCPGNVLGPKDRAACDFKMEYPKDRPVSCSKCNKILMTEKELAAFKEKNNKSREKLGLSTKE